ncbi:MAG: tryptophan-rich sensory protein [Rhodospirillales bacterium]|nr:MAG: tryptophan-rich sensory protein [Rhodospirillales bacterium]
MSLEPALSLLLFVIACAAAATPGIAFRPGAWYRALAKPRWCPPDWLFGPVWLVLYLSVAVAGWLVWRRAGLDGAALPLAVYAVQLVLNGLWSTLFFGLRRPDLAFVEVIGLWLSILATIALFHPIDTIAAWLLIPYAAWVGFAALLNLSIWRLNPGRAAT